MNLQSTVDSCAFTDKQQKHFRRASTFWRTKQWFTQWAVILECVWKKYAYVKLWHLKSDIAKPKQFFLFLQGEKKETKLSVTTNSLNEPLNKSKHVNFKTTICWRGIEGDYMMGNLFIFTYKITSKNKTESCTRRYSCHFSQSSLWKWECSVMSNYLAKLHSFSVRAADHKRSSYSVSSIAVPGSLSTYQSKPSGLCQAFGSGSSSATGREAVMSLCRSGKEQGCIF